MTPETLLPDTVLTFYPIQRSSWPDETGYYAYTRLDTDDSMLLDGWRVQALALLQTGVSVGDVQAALGVAEEELQELVAFLIDGHFVQSLGGELLPDAAEPIRPWLAQLPPERLTWLLSKPLLVGLSLFVASGLVLSLRHPNYLPSLANFFWTEDLFWAVVAIFVVDLVSTALHEAAHFITTKAVGAQARIRFFDNRFLDLVMVTEHYHLILVPKPLRYYVYLSGMLIQLVLISGLLWLYWLAETLGWDLGLWHTLGQVFILVTLLGLLWQFNLFLETDLYNVLADFTGHQNLYINTKKRIGERLAQWQTSHWRWLQTILLKAFLSEDVVAQADEEHHLTTRERRHIHHYALLLGCGLFMSLLSLLLVQLPRDLFFLWKGGQLAGAALWRQEGLALGKALLMMLLTLYPYLGVGLIIFAKLRRRQSYL
jgi:hypothetical protein